MAGNTTKANLMQTAVNAASTLVAAYANAGIVGDLDAARAAFAEERDSIFSTLSEQPKMGYGDPRYGDPEVEDLKRRIEELEKAVNDLSVLRERDQIAHETEVARLREALNEIGWATEAIDTWTVQVIARAALEEKP